MRRIVDTGAEPGRIVLISGKVYTSYDSTFSNLGDCDFSKDLHGFRYRKSYEIVLIHNALAKPALIQCANFAFNFETVLTQLEDAWEEQMGERKLKRKKKKYLVIMIRLEKHQTRWSLALQKRKREIRK